MTAAPAPDWRPDGPDPLVPRGPRWLEDDLADELEPDDPTIPEAPVILMDYHRILYWAVVRCPYCRGRHHHGGDRRVPPLGVRRSHCGTPGGGLYVLTPVGGRR